jgi:hypothetical protein
VNCKCINDESRAENRVASYSALWRKLLNYYCKNGGGAGIIYVVNMSLDDLSQHYKGVGNWLLHSEIRFLIYVNGD